MSKTLSKKEYQKQYKLKNREKINKQNLEWYHRNRQTQLPKQKQYREKNQDKIKKYIETQ